MLNILISFITIVVIFLNTILILALLYPCKYSDEEVKEIVDEINNELNEEDNK